jgi:hypothetical protein
MGPRRIDVRWACTTVCGLPPDQCTCPGPSGDVDVAGFSILLYDESRVLERHLTTSQLHRRFLIRLVLADVEARD